MSKKVFYPLLILIFALAFVHCINEIEQKNMWFDEVYSWNLSLDSPKTIIETASGDIHPPLFYLTLKLWTNLFSDTVFSMRLLSVLLVIGGMFWTFRICRQLKISDGKILLILLLYTFSPLLIYYAQEVRMQSLNLFLSLGSTYFFLLFLDKKKNIHGIVWAVFASLSIYTHYFALLILFSQFIILMVLYFRKQFDSKFIRRVFLFSLLPLLAFSPWLPTFFKQTSQGQPWRIPQNIIEVSSGYLRFFNEAFFSYYWNYENKGVILGVNIVSVLLILFLLVFSIRYFLKKDGEKLPTIILFFIPSLIAFLISFRQSIIFSRYLLITVPYLLILFGMLIFSFKRKLVSYPLYIILIASSAFGLTINFANDYKNNDYRKIESYLEKNSSPNDKVIVEPHYLGWIIKYDNWHKKTSLPAPDILGWGLQMQIDSLAKRNDIKNVWMVLDYSSMEKNGYDSLNVKMTSIGFKADSLKEKTFYPYPAKVKTAYFYK